LLAHKECIGCCILPVKGDGAIKSISKREDKVIKLRKFVLAMLIGMLLLTTGCGDVGILVGGQMKTYNGHDSLVLKTPRPDILDIITEVGKSDGYDVSALDAEGKTITLTAGNSPLVMGFLGTANNVNLTFNANEEYTKLDIGIVAIGNFGAGSQDKAMAIVKDFKSKLLSRLEYVSAPKGTVAKVVDSRPCVANYSTEGGVRTGKQFKTFEDFPAVSRASAFDNLLVTCAACGYQITKSDKDVGIIGATQTVAPGKIIVLNMIVRTKISGGIRVEIVASLPSGLTTSNDAVKHEFCKMLASVSQ
jgi:hypothetical protein